VYQYVLINLQLTMSLLVSCLDLVTVLMTSSVSWVALLSFELRLPLDDQPVVFLYQRPLDLDYGSVLVSNLLPLDGAA